MNFNYMFISLVLIMSISSGIMPAQTVAPKVPTLAELKSELQSIKEERDLKKVQSGWIFKNRIVRYINFAEYYINKERLPEARKYMELAREAVGHVGNGIDPLILPELKREALAELAVYKEKYKNRIEKYKRKPDAKGEAYLRQAETFIEEGNYAKADVAIRSFVHQVIEPELIRSDY